MSIRSARLPAWTRNVLLLVLFGGTTLGCGWIWTPPENFRAGEDWQTGTPFGLLALLASQNRTVFRVESPIEAFVSERDLGALVKLVESDRRCAAVVLSKSGEVAAPAQFSTIGNEAAYLIEGFRAGRYPPRQSSVDPPPDVDEILRWWQAREAP